MRAQCHTARGGNFELCGSLSPQRPALSRCVIVGPQHKPARQDSPKLKSTKDSHKIILSPTGGGGCTEHNYFTAEFCRFKSWLLGGAVSHLIVWLSD